MLYLTLVSAYCLVLLLVPTVHFNRTSRGVATCLFYFLCLLSGSRMHLEALAHKVQIGTEVVGHGGFLADDYNTIEPVYGVDDTWLLFVLGMPVLAVLLLRFFKRPARLHPFIAGGYLFYLISSLFLPAWLNPW